MQEAKTNRRPLLLFLSIVVLYLVLWVVNARLAVPIEWLRTGSIIASIVFIGLPIIGIYCGSKLDWTSLKALLSMASCLAILALLGLGQTSEPVLVGVLQIARLGWPFALGILVTVLIKDKNLLLPIAVVIATVDILAVFAPAGTVKQGLESETVRPIFDALAFQVPKFGTIAPQAQLGPADPLFLGTYFHAVHKFKMRERATLIWVLPALTLYLLVVLAFGHQALFGISLGALPALVPMGIAVLAANFKEFDPSKEERLMIVAVSLLCLATLAAAAIIW
ncbi:MAG: hypothetical protein ACR2HJ_01640 [Fimbriimonadales bacterium]